MSVDFLKSNSAVVLNAWIDNAEAETAVPYTGERFVSGVDWNLQIGGEKYNNFIKYLSDNGLGVENAQPINAQSDWDQEQIWEKVLPQMPDAVYEQFFGDRNFYGSVFAWREQFKWG